jgi:hypothetical protein
VTTISAPEAARRLRAWPFSCASHAP